MLEKWGCLWGLGVVCGVSCVFVGDVWLGLGCLVCFWCLFGDF